MKSGSLERDFTAGKTSEKLEKVLDKRGWRWYYIEAVREGSKIMPKTREI